MMTNVVVADRMRLYDDPNPSWPEEMILRYMSF